MKKKIQKTKGFVVQAFGNLLHVKFDGVIQQGEVGFVNIYNKNLNPISLKAEVIEIKDGEAKLQVFEDTTGIKHNSEVVFENHLLEAELGPGLLKSIFDGLQNPLEMIGKSSEYFLPIGMYIPPLDKEQKWKYTPIAKNGDIVTRGDTLGTVPEESFIHQIMVPFTLFGNYKITWTIKPGEYCIDEIIAKGKNVDTGEELTFSMVQKWPIKKALIEGKKIKAKEMLKTGMRTIDTQLPIVKGGTFCTPGPFGAGKTVLQHHLAKYSCVDIVVVAACGERAGEVVEILKEFPHLIDPNTNGKLINRTIIICNTSSMPVAARESSVYMGITIAEYYRQMGLDVLLLADSTSRWAQAMREMSGRLEEIPGEEAFPAYLSSRIAEFYERSGVIKIKGKSKTGSVTIGGAVSPAGGNFEEPVTQYTLAVVGAFLGLSRNRAYARRYPAIDALISWSKYHEDIAEELEQRVEKWGEKVMKADKILRQSEEIQQRLEVVGEEGTSIDEMTTYLKGELYDNCYLQQNSFDDVDSYCPLERQITTFELMQEIFDKPFKFTTHDDARHFFLELQNLIKNSNLQKLNSKEYKSIMKKIKEIIDNVCQYNEKEALI